ncbi:MAG: beta-propeller fold lactonase family protein [Thermoplasmata archaeon]|nr:beta-propeller fold lactonase family protein [Thermoplasmata archaeon]
MKRPSPLWLIPVAAALLLLVPAAASAQAPIATPSVPSHGAGGAVFTMSNAVSGNSVIAYRIGSGGALIPAGTFATHGLGTGASLADSGALALTANHEFLLVVNAGSHSISVFHVNAAPGPVLTFVDQTHSRGQVPVSITVHGWLVYVLNAGDSSRRGNIAGFQLGTSGVLTPLIGSREPLSTNAPTGPAQISFNPSGHVLVVTEKNTNLIDTYVVGTGGLAQAPTVTVSNGTTPYGFAWGKGGSLIVSDAAIGALSSYSVASNGALTVVSGSVADGGAAPCWVTVAHGGTWVYTTNAHGSTISTYQVGTGGTLTLVSAVAATTGAADTDMAVGGPHGQYLFVYDAGAGEIEQFAIGSGGSLTLLSAVFSLPATAEGMAAF